MSEQLVGSFVTRVRRYILFWLPSRPHPEKPDITRHTCSKLSHNVQLFYYQVLVELQYTLGDHYRKSERFAELESPCQLAHNLQRTNL